MLATPLNLGKGHRVCPFSSVSPLIEEFQSTKLVERENKTEELGTRLEALSERQDKLSGFKVLGCRAENGPRRERTEMRLGLLTWSSEPAVAG